MSSTIPLDPEGFAQEILKDDLILPFQLESSSLRGRLVRLGSVLDDIIRAHAYPEAVNTQLAQALTLSAMLASMLKYDGIFTLQAQGEGALSMVVCDVESTGQIRGCATFNADELPEEADATMKDLMDKGYIAFTVDQGPDTERYQGIVELKGNTLVDSVQHYFVQSEQIDTGIILYVGQRDGQWRAQGMMVQRMPEEGGIARPLGNAEEDDWRRAMILMQSAREDEMLDSGLSPHDMLTRLFHEEGVRVYNAQPLHKGCRCSEEKVAGVLQMMSEEDIRDMTVDGVITMTCEFCSHHYKYDVTKLASKLPN